MEIIPFSKIEIKEWDEFCLASKMAWFRHTSGLIKFLENLSLDYKSENISFAVCRDNRIVAVAPLFIRAIRGEQELFEFSADGGHIVYPALADVSQKDKQKIIKFIFEEIDRRAVERKIAYAKFFVDSLTDEVLKGGQRCNLLPKFGFFETSLLANIIDLSLSEEDLLKNMHRGHAADITSVIRDGNAAVDVFGRDNFSEDSVNFFKELYRRAAGKQTAPDEKWNILGDFIKTGQAALFLLKNKKSQEYFSGIILFLYKKRAFFAFSAIEPELKKTRGAGHILQWEAIKYLKKIGFGYYEIGWNYYSVISDSVPSPKEINISRFKSHFGGGLYPLFRGEKFYDMDYLRKKRNDLTEKFISQYSDGKNLIINNKLAQ